MLARIERGCQIKNASFFFWWGGPGDRRRSKGGQFALL